MMTGHTKHITAMTIRVLTSFYAVQIHDLSCDILHYLRVFPTRNNQLLLGLIAQLREHCAGVAEVMGSNPTQA